MVRLEVAAGLPHHLFAVPEHVVIGTPRRYFVTKTKWTWGAETACLPRLRRPPNVIAGCHDRIMGQARFTYRVRVSATAERALLGEWDRCRWVWNQCVAESRQARKDKRECGPARLDKMLTGWRARARLAA